MRILITGAAGFIGHHVAHHLEEKGNDVVALVRLGKIGEMQRLHDVGFKGEVVWHDLRSPLHDGVADKIGMISAIIHMGAETHVDRSIDCPMEFVMSNVVGTTNLLEYARRRLKGPYIQFSTDEVFGPAPEGVEFLEDARHSPKNPYAASKSGAEQMVTAFANTYGLHAMIVRSMNVFGPRQHKEKFIPMTIRKVILGQKVQIHASKDLKRAGSRFYTHASVVADALEHLLRMGDCGKAYHVVGDREVDNLQMAQSIAGILDKELWHEMINFHESRPGHDLRYALADTQMESTGWTRKSSFDENLRSTVEWYMKNPEWIGL